jgi:hypothetical protein
MREFVAEMPVRRALSAAEVRRLSAYVESVEAARR